MGGPSGFAVEAYDGADGGEALHLTVGPIAQNIPEHVRVELAIGANRAGAAAYLHQLPAKHIALAGLQSSDRPDMAVISPDLRDGPACHVIERLTSLGVTVAIASGDDRTIPECWAALPRLPKPVVRADLARFLRVSVGSAVA